MIKNFMNDYQTVEQATFDCFCCLYPTAPFVTSERLKDAFSLLKTENFDSVLPIMPFSFPIQRSFVKEGHVIKYAQPENEKARSQDLKKHYHDAGQFYWGRTEKCLQSKSLMTKNSGSIDLNELEGQDIDTETDWKLAELKYELLQNLK